MVVGVRQGSFKVGYSLKFKPWPSLDEK